MSASKNGSDKSFYPGVIYPISQVANNLDTSEKWVKENLIYNRACGYKKVGQCYIFLGDWLIKWCLDQFEIPGDE